MSTTTYANMVGNICLDKAVNEDGNPAPVTFQVRQVTNGCQPWQRSGSIAHSRDLDTLQGAIERLHCLFLMEMEERDHELRIDGEPYYLPLNDGTDNFGYLPYQGQSGWYDLYNNCSVDLVNPSNNKADYALADYPLEASEWVARGITSYAYDNYKVCIVTSAGNIVY